MLSPGIRQFQSKIYFNFDLKQDNYASTAVLLLFCCCLSLSSYQPYGCRDRCLAFSNADSARPFPLLTAPCSLVLAAAAAVCVGMFPWFLGFNLSQGLDLLACGRDNREIRCLLCQLRASAVLRESYMSVSFNLNPDLDTAWRIGEHRYEIESSVE